MKLAPWTLGGVLLSLVVFGLAVSLGLLRPGGLSELDQESPGETSPSSAAQTVVKTNLTQPLGALVEERSRSEAKESSHRLFVARTLLFLPKEAEQVQPLNPAFVTQDGIQVGWKIKHKFSPEDPEVAGRDEDNDGFTNAEEFEKKTDPRDPQSTPSKWAKLRLLASEPASLSLEFPGKWTRDQQGQSDRFTLRLRDSRIKSGKRDKAFDVDISVGDRLWVAATGKNVKIFRSEEEARKEGDAVRSLHLIPIEIKSYQAKQGKKPDSVTQLEVEYDDSTLVGERLDGLRQNFTLTMDGKDARGQPMARGVVWDVSDYRLISLVPGEGEMGPYRAGQSFSYSGKDFLLVEGRKDRVILSLLPEKEELQVFPKTP